MGADPLQALLLAIQFLGRRLRDHLEDGNRVLEPDEDEDVGLDSYFGALLDAPGPPRGE